MKRLRVISIIVSRSNYSECFAEVAHTWKNGPEVTVDRIVIISLKMNYKLLIISQDLIVILIFRHLSVVSVAI